MTHSTAEALGGQNVAAFLDMLAFSELGHGLITAQTDDGYRVLVGSTPSHPLLFDDYSTPPNVYNKATNSTAAGRYQFLHRYWHAYQTMLKLPDFGPESQDLWAVQLVKERHAFADVQAGRIPEAIAKCSNIWASLPGSPYGQHTNKLDALLTEYTRCGGTLA